MAGHIAHNELYKGVYKKLPVGMKKEFEDTWDQYRILGQGHDLLFFYMFLHLNEMPNILKNLAIIENIDVQKFTINYIGWLSQNNLCTHESLLFLYGYLMHHFLDAKLHPLIIYETGDLVNDKNARDNHLYLENKIDAAILKRLGIDPRSFRMQGIVPSNAILSKGTREVVRDSFAETYSILNFDKVFANYNNNTNRFLTMMRNDPRGIKKKIFQLIDPLLMGAFKPSVLPFIFDGTEADESLNLNKEFWSHPVTGKISDKSFFELYAEAEEEIAHMIGFLHEAIMDKAPNMQIESIVPDISSITGQPPADFEIIHTKGRNR